jgi:hypothetical protein
VNFSEQQASVVVRNKERQIGAERPHATGPVSRVIEKYINKKNNILLLWLGCLQLAFAAFVFLKNIGKSLRGNKYLATLLAIERLTVCVRFFFNKKCKLKQLPFRNLLIFPCGIN